MVWHILSDGLRHTYTVKWSVTIYAQYGVIGVLNRVGVLQFAPGRYIFQDIIYQLMVVTNVGE